MRRFTTGNQFWTEIAASTTGLIDSLCAASSTLSAHDILVATKIRDHGVLSAGWRAQEAEQFLWLVRKVLTQKTATTD